MTIRIGINPITWTNDDVPELGGDTPLEVCLAEIRMSGYHGTEMGGKFPRESSVMLDVLNKHKLDLISGWYSGRLDEREVDEEFAAILPHLTLLRDCGSRYVVYADTSNGRDDGIWQPISQRPRLATDEFPAYGRKLTSLAEKMQDFGVSMAFHHHMGTIVETDEEIDLLMKHTGLAVGLLFDTGHCLFAGGNPEGILDRHAKRVVHVHCKDVRLDILNEARSNDMSFMGAVLEGVFTVPGDGCINYVSLFEKLRCAGYEGWLVVEAEQDPKKANPLIYATMGFRNLTRMVQDVGFVIEHVKN